MTPNMKGTSTKSIRPVTYFTGQWWTAQLHFGDKIVWQCTHMHSGPNDADACSDDVLATLAADVLDRYHKARAARSER